MKSRDREFKIIDFTDDQQDRLFKILGRKDIAAKLFLEESKIPLSNLAYGRDEDPPSTRGQIKVRLTKAHNAATLLHEILSSSKIAGDHYQFVDAVSCDLRFQEEYYPDLSALEGEERFNALLNYELAYDAKAEVLIERLISDIGILSKSLESPLEHFRGGRRGRPNLSAEVWLIMRIARLYWKYFGELPASHSRGSFHQFIIVAVGFAGYPRQSWYRAIKLAIDRLKSPPVSE